jgi:hypothetical protein
MTYVNRHPRGQQRDKPFREALRMEACAIEQAHDEGKPLPDLPVGSLRWNARQLLMCGDLPAIRELADRLDGKPAQAIEHTASEGDDRRITEVGYRIVHVNKTQAELDALNAEEAELARKGSNGGLQ